MTEKEFAHWLCHSPAGDRCTYEHGYLAILRRTNKTASKVARMALEACAAGLVELTQKRISFGYEDKPGQFLYYATKRKIIKKPNNFSMPVDELEVA